MRTAIILAVLALSTASLSSPGAEQRKAHVYKVGSSQRSFIPSEPYNWRGAKTHALTTTIWYPADSDASEEPKWIGSPDSPFASAGKAAQDAQMAPVPARFPLILLSHGTGGSALMMAWLGTQLAAHGYIAAAINHPGNNGTEPYMPQGFGLWWERAKDLSTLIDQMTADATFRNRIDPKRIAAAGFSLGGYTMIEIAGGITQPSLYRDFCVSHKADDICGDPPEFPGLTAKLAELTKTDSEFQASMLGASNSYRDPRIRAVFAIAPALGIVFRPESLAKISIPVEIVSGDADKNVPVASSAQYFAKRIPRAKLTLLPGVGHYAFLATCSDRGRQSRPQLCVDPPGIDRDAVHSKVAGMAIDFFGKHLR